MYICIIYPKSFHNNTWYLLPIRISTHTVIHEDIRRSSADKIKIIPLRTANKKIK